MFRKLVIVITMIVLLTIKGFAGGKLFSSLPKEIMGWSAQAKDEVFDREKLYEYIDGGAELYLTFDFQKVFVRRFNKENAPEIVLEIYDMGSSKDAYGIFSIERQDEQVGIGQDSEYGGGLLRFWKDKYFISILALGDEPLTRPMIFELGNKVAAAIPSIGQRPEILTYLPQENLLQHKIRFFHSPTILNRQYFLASENILTLDRQTDCVFACYQFGDDKCYLLIIKYENATKAAAAYHNFMKVYLPEATATGIMQMENGKWTATRMKKDLIMIIFEASQPELAENLLLTVSNLVH